MRWQGRPTLTEPGPTDANTARSAVVGFTAGVFDLFHVGHLNVIERSRALCDRLIVGVSSDALVCQLKGRPPVIAEGDRMRIVAALRAVDQVVLQTHTDYVAEWQRLRFDVITKGDDWKGTPKWIELERTLGQEGVRVHFLPYTQEVSSTRLRGAVKHVRNERR